MAQTSDIEVMRTVMLPVALLVENKGQIPGVPRNPRKISGGNLRKMVQSVREYPGMMAIREPLVFPFNGKYVIIGGNMRCKAMRELGWDKVPCKVLPPGTTVDTLNAYILRDNSHYGEWDFDALADFTFGDVELANIDLPEIPSVRMDSAEPLHGTEEQHEMPVAEQGRRHSTPYQGKTERRCDLVQRQAVHFRDEFACLTSFRRTEDGVPLSEIKCDGNVELFAQSALKLIKSAVKLRQPKGWAIVTTPSRRHKDWNFADAVCERLSGMVYVPYLKGFAEAKNRDRINPKFAPLFEIEQDNIILYDDIATTYTTLRAMHDILPRKNILTIVGIDNN